jgi:K+-transporting ATPase ATPase C chain
VARERGTSEENIRQLLRQSTNARQLGFLGEPRVNVLQLNIALDAAYPTAKGSGQ